MTNRLLFNAGNLIKGGAVQATVNFILASHNNKTDNLEWFYIINKVIENELHRFNLSISSEKLLILQESPAKNSEMKTQCLQFEQSVSPSLVFSLFGPAYVSFKSFHISGFANGWVTHSTMATFKATYPNNWLGAFKALLKYIYYALQIRKANAWILETNVAKQGFVKRLKVKKSLCHVVPNTSIELAIAKNTSDTILINDQPLKYDDHLFLSLAANYPHKNTRNLLLAASILANKDVPFKLVLTLPEQEYKKEYDSLIRELNITKHVVNIGEVSVKDIPLLYSVISCSVLPSFIETFSAVYPESFATQTPVITSDLAFAREICEDAADYVDPNEPRDIAEKMYTLLKDNTHRERLISAGSRVYKQMLSPNEKYNKYMNVIEHYLNIRPKSA